MMDTRKNFLIQWIRYIKFGLQYYILEKPRGLDFTMRDKSVINQEKGFHGYNKTNENHLRDIFSCLPFEEGLSLIDIGCGKGAVLKEGIKYSFKKLGGIEVSEELVTIAKKNFERLHIADKVECLLADATNYQGYDQYNVFYFYNPFGKEILEKVLDKIESGIQKKKTEKQGMTYYLIYYHPLYPEVVEKYQWKLKKELLDKLRQYKTYIYERKE